MESVSAQGILDKEGVSKQFQHLFNMQIIALPALVTYFERREFVYEISIDITNIKGFRFLCAMAVYSIL